MAFFWSAMHVGGKKAAGKSSNKVEKPNRKRKSSSGVYGKFWAAVANLEDTKLDGGCVVAGSDEINMKHCALGLDHPYLVINASDWSCSNFGKQLGIVMLEQKFTLCLESRGLERDGMLRLVAFVKASKALFDSRMTIVIFGDEGSNADIEGMCDEYFSMENMLEVTNKESKIIKTDSKSEHSALNLKETEEKLKLVQNDLSFLQKQNSKMRLELDAKCDEVKDLQLELCRTKENLKAKVEELHEVNILKENWKRDLEAVSKEKTVSENVCKDLKAKMAVLKESSEDKCKENDRLEKLVLEQKGEFKKMSEECEKNAEQLNFKILEGEEIKERIKELELLTTFGRTDSKDHKASVQDQATQTDSVEISRTSLSVLRENLDKNKTQSISTVDLVYKSIRDLKCLLSYSEVNVGFKCDVKIIKGKHVMKCPDLINFSGQGNSQSEAKKAAFANFVDIVAKT